MTNLEALQSMTEFSDANLFAKVMTDRGVNPAGTYSAAQAQAIDLCLADVYLALASKPSVSEGGFSEQWNPERLLELRRKLYDKWGLALPETTNEQNTPGVTGHPVTLGGICYPGW